jgi:hypothetical protein
VHVESLPEQGTSFVVALPLPPDGVGAEVPPGARHPVPEDARA